jgi:hypothetical protein
MTALAAKYFTTADVFAATGVRPETQHQWADRRVTIPGRRDKVFGGSGSRNKNSTANVYQLAITSELAALGVGPKPAARAARKFTNEGQPGREPGVCFEHFKTVLVVTPGDASVQNVGFGARIEDVMAHHSCAVVVDINRIVTSVNNKLSKLKGRK